MDATKRGETFYQDLLDTCLTAGELMIEGGSEMYRVEDTMMRIAKSAGEPDPRVFVVPTGMFMNNYDWIDFPAAAIVGATGFISFYYFKRFTNVKFLSELVAAVIMTVLAAGLVHIFPQMIIDHILTGALMPLVPGLALTNALRDLFKGDILSGMVKICEALLTAFALGGGVGIVLKFLGA